MKYGIKITKPWSKEMYAHNEDVKETVINEVRDRWEIAYQEAEQDFLDNLEEDQQGMLFEDSDWNNANQTMQEIQEAVTIVNFATGFEVGTAYTRRAGYEIVGRDNTRLSDKWANGLVTLHGLQTHDFPNCFFMGVTQGGFTANFPHMLNEQSLHIAYMMKQCKNSNANCIEASIEGENDWVAEIKRMAAFNDQFLQECTPGYYNNEGSPDPSTSLIGSQYGGGPEAFFQIIRDWRSDGTLKGTELS